MSTNDESQNPTQRLYDMLVLAKSKATTGSIREVWAQVFGVDRKDTMAIFYNIFLLYQAFDWTERQVEKAGFKRKEIYTRNFKKIRNALSMGNIDQNGGPLGQMLTDETMADLLHCADRLSDIESESLLNTAELQELVSEVDGLFRLFEAAEIDGELKTAILDLLETARQLLADYRIRGSAAIKEIIELALGKLMTKRAAFAKEKQNSAVKTFVQWLLKLDKLYDKLTKYGPLLQGASRLLLEQAEKLSGD